MNVKVSILVPIYNVSKYIERCASSLFEQSFIDLEYIFVDDKSTDNSIDILANVIEKYPLRKSQVKIVEHNRNRGLAAARNTGVSNAIGDFIIHIDSDDFIDSNMIKKMYEKAIMDNADIVVCNYYLFNNKRYRVVEQNFNESASVFFTKLISGNATSCIWNKMIRRSLYYVNNITAKETINYGEDLLVIPKLVFFANKISKVNEPLYFYSQENVTSYTKSFSIGNINNLEVVISDLKDFLIINNVYEDYQRFFSCLKQKKREEIIFNADSDVINNVNLQFLSTLPYFRISYSNYITKFAVLLYDKRKYLLLNIYKRLTKSFINIIRKIIQ